MGDTGRANINSAKRKMCYSVYVVEDHPIFFEGLHGIIKRESDFELAGYAPDAATAKDEIPSVDPAIIVLDLGLPDGSGFDLIQFIKAVTPEVPILVLSGLDQSLYAPRALRAGARGFLSKEMAATNFIEAMRTVLSGDVYLDKEFKEKLLAESVGHIDATDNPLDILTDRELDVYRLLGSGLTVQEIADRLNLSPKTIETYRANLKRKLGVESSRDLVRDATIWCLVRTRQERPGNGAREYLTRERAGSALRD